MTKPNDTASPNVEIAREIASTWIAYGPGVAAKKVEKLMGVASQPPDATPPPILNWDTMRQMPVDLAEAVEQCKLAIIRHRADNWSQCSKETFVSVFHALAAMAKKNPA